MTMKHSEYLISNHIYQYHKDNIVKLVDNKNSSIGTKDKNLEKENQFRK